MSFRAYSVIFVATAMAGGCQLFALAAEPIDFNRQIRPILSAHCFKCHGPDEQTREAGLRLDSLAEATKKLDSGKQAIAPGEPDKSELLRRVLATDADERMPPALANKPLSAEQRKLLQTWVEQGASYAAHWAFVLPERPALPKVKQADWPRNEIDYFILARLEAANLKPSPQADKYALVRRAYLDLIGLPPTPAEADAFVSDADPRAYERLLDRLLESPQYGERWARRWLDLARYADTNGYEKDRPRSIWPYRDWVINALNADMPFDQFTIEQLAGDMLPGATANQKIATGFHRNTMLNEEGGIDPQEFRFYATVDRANTTATVWLGLTLGCAQCHTHKFDPIPHRYYYQLLAYFNNADEPEFEVPQSDLIAKRKEIEKQIAKLEADLPNRWPAPQGKESSEAVRREDLLQKFTAWREQQRKKSAHWELLRPVRAESELPTLKIEADQSIFASGDFSKRDVYDVQFETDLPQIRAIKLEVISDSRLPKNGPGRVSYEGPHGDFWLSELTVSTGTENARWKAASQSFASGKHTADRAIDGDPQTGWSINGGQGREHAAVFRLAEPLTARASLQIQLLFEKYYAAGLGRFRIWATADEDALATELPAEIERRLHADVERNADAGLLNYFLSVAPELTAERARIDALKKQLPAFPSTLVMQERPAGDPRNTHRHQRGEFLQPKEDVFPHVLSILRRNAEPQPTNRLEFARWLVDGKNPLTARVTVNRHWAALFGRGLVRTTDDFGYQGSPPTHPALLDWLATELPRRGWSIKQLHKLIMLSATYQQSAAIAPGMQRADPENLLLGRFPRLRVEAELIRDIVLKSAGLLSAKQGGPSVFPPQPAGVTSEGTYGPLAWKVSEGEDRYRRALYTFTKRTAPYAMLLTFDAPSGEACVPRREVSNSPLQALTLLNDQVFLEAAQALGKQLSGHAGDTSAKAIELFRRCLTRPPTGQELERILKFYAEQRHRIAAKEIDAATIAGPGEGELSERAAWTLVARALLNLDEAITKN